MSIVTEHVRKIIARLPRTPQMTYEFQNTIYRTSTDLLDAIAYEWLTAGGLNGPDVIKELQADKTDAELARECIKGWGLDEPFDGSDDEDPPRSWMDERGITEEDLVEAFNQYREE
jgi:hypothetical protein